MGVDTIECGKTENEDINNKIYRTLDDFAYYGGKLRSAVYKECCGANIFLIRDFSEDFKQKAVINKSCKDVRAP